MVMFEQRPGGSLEVSIGDMGEEGFRPGEQPVQRPWGRRDMACLRNATFL